MMKRTGFRLLLSGLVGCAVAQEAMKRKKAKKKVKDQEFKLIILTKDGDCIETVIWRA